MEKIREQSGNSWGQFQSASVASANSRKRRHVFGAAIAGVALSGVVTFLNQADAAVYSPAVTQVGDGTTALSTAGATTTIQVWQPNVPAQAAPVAQLAYGNTNLVNTGNASTEGNLTNNPALTAAAVAGQQYTGTAYVFSGGYASSDLQPAVDGNTTAANRVIGDMIVTTTSVAGAAIGATQTNASTYTGSNIRGVVGDDSAANFWSGGTGGSAAVAGYRYFNNSTQLVASPGPVNVRDVNIFGGQLYGTSDTGSFVGITSVGTGTPTTGGQTAISLVSTAATSAVGSSPYAFVLFNNPNAADPAGVPFNVAYIDDAGTGNGSNGGQLPGIQKWDYVGGSWTYQYSITDGSASTVGYWGLAGYLNGTNVVLYATQALSSATAPNNLEQFTDPLVGGTLAGTDATEITLATAPADDAFRGVALAVPEPATLGLLCVGAFGLFVRPRRRA